MTEAVQLAIIAVLGTVLGGGGAVTVWIKVRASRPSAVMVAIKTLEGHIEDQADEIKVLRTEVSEANTRARRAEERADEVVLESQGFKATIAQQSKALTAKDGRIIQLLHAWPPGSRPPAPHPEDAPYL